MTDGHFRQLSYVPPPLMHKRQTTAVPTPSENMFARKRREACAFTETSITHEPQVGLSCPPASSSRDMAIVGGWVGCRVWGVGYLMDIGGWRR